MENVKREPFKKYKELRVYFSIRSFVLKPDEYETDIDRPFDWFKFSSRGVIFKDKNSGMLIHLKYSSVEGAERINNSRALILEDVELFTPFIKENNEVKFITWEEWDEKYNTEKICERITSVTDEHLKEHNTDLMYILDKLCVCAGARNFDYPRRFIKVEPRYQDNEYSLHRVAAGFKWYHGGKIFDDIRYYLVYEAKNRTIHIDISKHETWYMPPAAFPSAFFTDTIPDDHTADSYSISVEFNKDYSISKVTVKNKNKENLLKFMEMGDPVIKNTIKQIRDYINSKLTEKQLTSRINVTNEINMYAQTWNFSPRVDISTKKKQKPTPEDIRNAMERGKVYDIEHTYFSTVAKYLFDEFGLTMDPSQIKGGYTGDASNDNENIYVSINKEACDVSLSVSDRLNGKIVVKMGFDNEDEFIDTVDVESSFKDYYDLSNSISPKTCTILQGLRTLLKSATTSNQFTFGVLDDHPFRLNLNGDIYAQIKNECDWIYNHTDDVRNRIFTCNGYVLSVSSGTLLEATREKIHFEFNNFASFHRITIQILDPNREKLKVTLGIEDSQLISISVNPGFDNFEKKISEIYNPRVKRLLSEIFNKLYKGEE